MKRMFAIALTVAFGLATPALADGDCGGCGEAEKKACEEGKTELAKDGCEGEAKGCEGEAKGCEGEAKGCEGEAKGCEGEAKGGCCGDMAANTKALERFRNLAGEWESTDADKDGQPDVRVTYKVTSNGSAVVETLMPGTPHEMVTVYHVDAQGNLMLTHFCGMGNQPRMRATACEGNTVKFEFVDGTNCDPAKGFMGQLTTTFEGEKVKHEWIVLKDGKPAQTVSFELTKSAKKTTK